MDGGFGLIEAFLHLSHVGVGFSQFTTCFFQHLVHGFELFAKSLHNAVVCAFLRIHIFLDFQGFSFCQLGIVLVFFGVLLSLGKLLHRAL